jgi:phenylacetic acid degradation operon negative regulatory protein
MVMADLQPRAVDGSFLSELPASSLLLTLYCDYWYASAEYVPSRALVALLEVLGVNEPAGRAALSRLARRGWLEGRKQGRRTAYRVAPDRLPLALAECERIVRFGADPLPWDGRWTCVAFSVPDADRHLRPVLRRRLRRLGLGPLYDGLWITPRAPLAAIDRVLTELRILDAAVFRVAEVPRPAGIDLLGAWDLPVLRATYDDLSGRLVRLRDRLAKGGVPPVEAFVLRADLMARWHGLMLADPELPDELLPGDWPRCRVRELVLASYDALGPAGERRAREIVGTIARTAAPRCHRAGDRLATREGGRLADHA